MITHRFEKAGLGKAPFRFIGISQKVGPITWEENGVTMSIGSPGQAMGTCAFCGTGIAECMHIRSADGKEFIVGNVCVNKTDDQGLVCSVKQAVNKKRTARRNELARKKIMAAMQLWDDEPALREAADKIPHPNEWARRAGGVLSNWIDWMWENAGQAGRLRVVKVINKLIN